MVWVFLVGVCFGFFLGFFSFFFKNKNPGAAGAVLTSVMISDVPCISF